MSAALLDLHPRDWPEWFRAQGARSFQGRSAAHWVFRRGIGNWEGMSDLPAELRLRLSAESPLLRGRVRERSASADGACKLLIAWPEGDAIEAVGMPGSRGRTFCLSTQVGCPVRCRFCASGAEGLARNLSRAEILEQILHLRGELGSFQRLVVMGMGDAGYNLEPTLAALESLLDPEGANLSARRLTLSTVAPRGVLPRLAAWGRPIGVALSLHAPDDVLRHQLVPGIAKRSIAETLAEAEALFHATGREYTVEYVLLAEVNDAPDQAHELARLLRGKRCHLNLIPYNPIPGLAYRRPALRERLAFASILREAGLSVTLRRSLGRAAEAACGQLRRRSLPT